MGLIDKLKNVFFEEVEEDDDEEVEEVPKAYAKKVELPKKKSFLFKNDEEKEEKEEKNSRKALNHFLEEDDVDNENNTFEEEIKEEVKEEPKEEIIKPFPMMFDDEDFYDEESVDFDNLKKDEEDIKSYKREDREYNNKELYPSKKDSYISNINNSPSYTYTKTTYYEEKETKGFKPSPIISPIYGILDKNYRKEEVVTKRETRISGTFKKPDLDSVRNKVLASTDEEKEKRTKDVKKYNGERKVYDVNNNKPQVSKVTLADADEYYNDLGLAYNEDYSDASREVTRSSKYNTRERKKEKKDVDDNLFDLIDSMYNKED